MHKLSTQANEISALANWMRDYLTKPSTVRHFLKHPSVAESLLTSAQQLKSKTIILYGLKESLANAIAELERQGEIVDASNVDVLPTKTELTSPRSQNWLASGDIITGWIGYLADVPRVIQDVTLSGYTWHFWDDEKNVKGPGLGINKFDPWLQSYGWVKLSGNDAKSIEAEQSAEIEALTAQLEYFQSKAFLQA